MSSAVDASMAGSSIHIICWSIAQKMSKMEEEGSEKWTEEQLAETMMEFSGDHFALSWVNYRQNAHGRMESDQAWSHSSDTVYSNPWLKIDIRDVCDKLLDKSVPEKQRRIRAEAILMIGRIFRAAERDPGQADNGDYAFEQLLASSQKPKKKKPSKPVASNGKGGDVD